MNKVVLLLILNLSVFSLSAQELYSNNQGILGPQHDQSHQARILKTFYTKDSGEYQFDEGKTRALLEKIKNKKESVKESFYLSVKTEYINNHNYSDKKASKKAKKRVGEDARAFFAFEYVTDGLKELLRDIDHISEEELEERVSDISIILETIDYLYQDNLVRSDIRSLQNLIVPFHTIDKKDSWKSQASNLYLDGDFLSPEDIKRLMEKGLDISEIDPPSSAFWTNNEIENFDVFKNEHRGEPVFPREDDVFVFDRFGGGNIKIKADTYPKEVKDACDPDIDNKNITIRLGQETNNHLIAANLARAIGYPYIPHSPRKSVLLYLCDTTFESFLQQWEKENQDRQGSFHTHGEYLPEIHAVRLDDLALEGYPGKDDNDRYRKGGTFRTETMGLQNRREFRSLVIFNALIALVDATERNVRVDFHRAKNEERWNPIIFINDLGRSLGHYFIRTHGTVNDYTESFVKEKDDKIRIWWDHQGYDSKLFSQTTLSDARWIARRLSRLSNKQINDIVENTLHAQPVKELYKVKIKKRILNLIKALGLRGEVQTDFVIPSYEELHRDFPKYISKDGKITYEADNIQSVTSRPRGVNTSIFEAIAGVALNQVFNLITQNYEKILTQEKILDNGQIEVFGGSFDMGMGIRLSSSRDISVNPEKGENENRFLIKDSMLISVPIGLIDKDLNGGVFSASLPIGAQYTYRFDYFHSVSTLKEAVKTDFFKRLIPWRASSLQENLSLGEGLFVEHSIAKSIGELSLDINDNLRAGLSPLSLKTSKVKQTYLYRSTPNLLEVADSRSNQLSLGSRFELTAYLSLRANWSRIKREGRYAHYRFFLDEFSSQDEQSINELVKTIVDDEKNKTSQTYAIASSFRQNNYGGCFFVWCRNLSHSEREFDITSYDDRWKTTTPLDPSREDQEDVKIIDNYHVLTSSYIKSSDRKLSRIWNDDLSLGPAESALNFLFSIMDEGKTQRINIEATWDEEKQELDNIDLRIQILRRDNFLTQSEVIDWQEFYASRAYCQQSSRPDEGYLNIKQDGIDFYSPITSVMAFQLKKKGIGKILKNYKDKMFCKRDKNCRLKVDYLLGQKPKNKEQAQRHLKELRGFFKKILGKDFSNLGCLRESLKEKHYWLTTKVLNPLEYTTPISRDEADLYAKELGKFQGQSFLEEFVFESYFRPVISKKNVSTLGL